MNVLRYGTDSAVALDFEEGVLLADCGHPAGKPLDHLEKAVAAALDDPLAYPALSRCTTPSDRVVLALDHGVPQAAQVTAAVVRSLVNARVHPDGITLLQSRPNGYSPVEDPCRLLQEPVRSQITLATHAPADREQLGYLGADTSGEPILVNRAIHDADLVLPIGCVHSDAASGYFGIHTPVFPTFSDERTLQRFRTIGALDPRRDYEQKLAKKVEEVAWLLGISFTIQLVPAGGASILHVLAGQCDAVGQRARELYHTAWNGSVSEQASLVVAAIEGDSDQQTWVNIGRALDAAVPLVEDGGAIAVCCDLAARPGPVLRRLSRSESRQATLRQIGKERPEDTLIAGQLARALDCAKIYLLSRLEPSLVEELDMIHVASGKELARLAGHHKSCILLANAPYATVKLK